MSLPAHKPIHTGRTPSDAAMEYRPVSLFDIVCIALLPGSLLGLVHPNLIVIGLAGAALTGRAWWLQRHHDHCSLHTRLLTVALLGHAGLASSVFLWNTYWEHQEVPAGYTRINFSEHITRQISLDEDKSVVVSPVLQSWIGRSVAISGSIWPTKSRTMMEFLLFNLSDPTFGSEPKQDGTIVVRLAAGQTIDWQHGRWTASGRLTLGEIPEWKSPFPKVLILVDAQARPSRSPYGLHD